MKRKLLSLGLAIAMFGAVPAVAETVGLGSTVRGGTSQIGKAIAAAISGNSGMQMRPQEMANTADYMPLANAGMTLDDVKAVPVPNFPRMWNSFKQGTTDATIVVVGSKTNREMDATLKGGVRFISFDQGKLGGMQNWMPGMYLTEVKPSPKLPGVEGPTNVMTYDYTFFASTATKDATVYEAVKTLHKSEKQLLATGPFWRGFHGGRMANKVDVPFHPGAIKFYKEIGIWKE